MILKHYEDTEEYECCSGILKAINEYRESIKVNKGLARGHKLL